MQDRCGREIEYMRISVTDRCNLRCKYCIPDGIDLVPMDKILSYEEIALIVKCAVSLGITRFKITGGEPLVRKGVTELIKMIKSIEGALEVTLTTNGILLPKYLDELKECGIDGINISLDTLDPVLYEKITGNNSLKSVLDGIDKSIFYGIKTKINAVVLSDVMIENYLNLAELAKDKSLDVRFIEMMPIGAARSFKSVDCNEIIKAISTKYPDIKKDTTVHGNGPAAYYSIGGFMGSIGIINAIHNKFCNECNRIRLSSTGGLKPCLYYPDTVNLKELIGDERTLTETMRKVIFEKPLGHDFATGEENMPKEKRKMSQIGG